MKISFWHNPLTALLMALCLTACGSLDSDLEQQDYVHRTIDVARMKSPVPTPPGAPLLYCRIGRGSALFGRNWYDFDETLFTLHRGDRISVSVPRQRGAEAMTIQAIFDSGGQKMVFCPVIAGPPDQHIRCTSLYMLEDDLQDGIKRTFDIPDAVRGGEISCATAPGNLKSLSIEKED